MFDSSSMSSPSLLLSQISDPQFVGRLCMPIINEQVANEDFLPPLITNSIVPEIKNIIKGDKKNQFESIPTIIRLMIENYPEIGVMIVKNDIFNIIQETIQTSGSRKAADLTDLFVEIASTIPSYYRDEILVDLIHKYTTDPDAKIRHLAVSLIPVVRDNSRVLTYFQKLAKDKVPTIRGAVIQSLSNCTFDENIINSILVNGTKDSNLGVQQIAASVFGSIAPQLVKDFCRILKNPNTVRYAFPQMPQIVACNSFAEIFDAFDEAIKYDKNDGALALIETVKLVDVKQESALYIRAARQLASFQPFAWRIHDFAKSFSNKCDFIELLDPKGITDWRTRYALLKQCEEFVPEVSTSLARLAEIYSEDQVAYVRNESVQLWNLILKNDPTIKSECIERLMRGSWHKRMILAKLIGVYGSLRGFKDAAEKLANDPVENVRNCLSQYYPHI